MSPASPDRAALGRQAEELACNFLQRRGLILVERNYRCRQGELDLIMRDGNATVFVEVRYRGNTSLVDAATSVDHAKQGRLVAAAQHYLQRHPRAADYPCRFDVVAVAPAAGQNRVEWITNAIELQ